MGKSYTVVTVQIVFRAKPVSMSGRLNETVLYRTEWLFGEFMTGVMSV